MQASPCKRWKSGDEYQREQERDKIAGDAVVDVGVGVGTVVASAAAGAKAGALIGTAVGGPIGTLAGAAISFGVSVGASYVMDGIKFTDFDGDGKKDTVTEGLKMGAEDRFNDCRMVQIKECH